MPIVNSVNSHITGKEEVLKPIEQLPQKLGMCSSKNRGSQKAVVQNTGRVGAHL